MVKKWQLLTLIILVFLLSIAVFWRYSLKLEANKPKEISDVSLTLNHSEFWRNKGIYRYTPSHAQIVWRFALEWHESQGRGIEAINPKDKDGTPSYYHYQFKPETLKYYAVKYELLPDNLEMIDYLNWSGDWELTSEILNRMMNDKEVKWFQEFPDVTKNKIGLPPKN